MKKFLSALSVLAILITMTAVAGGSAFAEEAGAEQPDMEVSDSLSYEAFLKAHENDARPSGSIPVDIAAFLLKAASLKPRRGISASRACPSTRMRMVPSPSM